MENLPGCRIDVSLLRTEAYLALDDPNQAHDWLQRVLTDIDAYHIDQRPAPKSWRPNCRRLPARSFYSVSISPASFPENEGDNAPGRGGR